ncbi:MAG: hypothetical protein M3R47_06595 [Chloroflexota bacterium]|nr:hypothetical protein [Chloroflexota bacterium]
MAQDNFTHWNEGQKYLPGGVSSSFRINPWDHSLMSPLNGLAEMSLRE